MSFKSEMEFFADVIKKRYSLNVKRAENGGAYNVDTIKKAFSSVRNIFNNWLADSVESEYEKQIRKLLKSESADFDPTRFLVEDSILQFDASTRASERTIEFVLMETQQKAIEEYRISSIISESMRNEISLRPAVKTLAEELKENLEDGKFIEINGKSYNVDSYAETVVRTKTAEAHSVAMVEAAQKTGTNLVRISSHNTQSEICKKYEGKVFSLNGLGGYPMLDAYPPFHPNCLHEMELEFQ